jgi:hypothetical protein
MSRVDSDYLSNFLAKMNENFLLSHQQHVPDLSSSLLTSSSSSLVSSSSSSSSVQLQVSVLRSRQYQVPVLNSHSVSSQPNFCNKKRRLELNNQTNPMKKQYRKSINILPSITEELELELELE